MTSMTKAIASIEAKPATALRPRIPALDTDNPTLPLKRVLSIYYWLYFKKDKSHVEALINSSNKVNAMAPTYKAKLGLKV